MNRLTDPISQAFWESQVDGTTVRITSGAPGKKPRTSEKTFPDDWKADSFALSKRIERMRAGYIYTAEVPGAGWYLALQVALGRVHTGFQSLEFVPERNWIVAAFARKDGKECDLLFVDAQTGQVERSLTLDYFDLWQVRADPTRDCLYFRVDGGTYRLELKSGTHTQLAATRPLQWTQSFDVSRGGDRICLSHHSETVIRDVDSGQELWRAPIPTTKPVNVNLNAALSPGGERVATAFEAGRIEVCELATGRTSTLTGDFQYPSSLVFHPSGRFLAATDPFGSPSLYLFDLESGANVVDLHAPSHAPSGETLRGRECHSVAFNPSGDRFFVRSGGSVAVYNFKSGEALDTLRPDLVARPNMDTSFQMLASRCPRTLVVRTDLGAILVYRYGESDGSQ